MKHHEDGRNLHGTRVSSTQPKPFWMRIWMRNPSPRYYVKASCDLGQEEQVGIIQNVLTAPKHLHYFSSELHTGTSNYFHSMPFIYFQFTRDTMWPCRNLRKSSGALLLSQTTTACQCRSQLSDFPLLDSVW